MHETSGMSTFEKYVVGTSTLSQDQMDACKAVQKALAGWGVPKTLEEVVLLKGVLDAEQMTRLLGEIKEKWKISIPRPVLYSIADEKDKSLQDQMVAQSPKAATQVLECRKIQESAKQLGVSLKVSEILIAKGYYAPGGPAPVAPTAVVTETDDLLPDDLLPDDPPPAKEPVRPGPARKPAPPAARKPAPAGRPAARPGAARDRESIELSKKKKNPLVLWLSIGGAAAALLIVIIIVLASGNNSGPEAPVVRGNKILLWADGGGAVPVYTERRLLEFHAGKATSADLSSPSNTQVLGVQGRLRTEKGLWYKVQTLNGADGWVAHVYLRAGFDLNGTEMADFKSEWSEKLAALKAPPAVAKSPEPEPARPAEPVKETPKAAEPPKPAPTPEPAARPQPTPEPVRPPEPAKPEPAPVKEPEPVKPVEPAPEPAKPAPPAPKPEPPKKPEPPAKPPQDKPKPPSSDPKKQAREEKAQALWDAAIQLEKEGKLAEAQEKLKELRTRYKSTSVYWDKTIEITDKVNEIGQRLAVGALLKTTLYKKPHMDSWYSFEFAPPDGWKGVPPQPNWFGEQDNDETFYRGRTYRIARYTAPYFDKLYMTVYKTFACESLEYLESKATASIEEYGFKGLKEESKSADRGKMPYLRKTYSTPAGDRLVIYYFFQDRKGLALVGAWRAGGEDEMWVRVTITTSSGSTTRKTKEHPVAEEDFKTALKVFDQAAKTFWIYDAATRQGKRVQLDMSALCADWQILKSSKGGYIIEYATRKEYAQRAADEMEQILGLYKIVLPSQKTIPPCRIKIFDREEDFQWYSYAFGAAAYWSPAQEEIVCYRFEGDKLKSKESDEEFTIAETQNPEEVTFKVLYHEGFHQYMYFYMGRERGVYVPSWLNEGMGDYFFGGQWVKGGGKKFEIGLNDWRLKTIYNAVKKGEHVPLSKIIRYEQQQYYANPGLCYAEGWALNYFFQRSDIGKKKGYHAIPRQMLQELKTSANWEKATDKVFGGLDLKKMEEEFKEYVLSLPAPKDKDDDANQ